ASCTAQLGFVMGAGWVWRRALLSTVLNRRIFFAVSSAFAGKLLVHVAAAIFDEPPWVPQAFVGTVHVPIASIVAFDPEPRYTPVAVAFAVVALASAAYPEWRYLFYAVANLVMLASVIWAHRRRA